MKENTSKQNTPEDNSFEENLLAENSPKGKKITVNTSLKNAKMVPEVSMPKENLKKDSKQKTGRKAKPADETQIQFESAMARLGEIVKCLEAGNASLDESMKWFEEGAKLSTLCYGKLDEAEQDISKLKRIDTKRMHLGLEEGGAFSDGDET